MPLMSTMHRHIVLAATLLILSCTLAQVSAQCPSALCFCSRSTAEFACNVPLLNGKCEVGQCTSAQCSTNGFRCQPKINATGIIPDIVIQEIRKQIEANGGCKGNVCFAIDGSGSISPKEYSNQLDFVSDVVRIINTFPTRVAGTQYNQRSNPIKSLSSDLGGFITALRAQPQLRGSTSISSGIDYCGAQLDTRPFEPKKVVVLGDGFQNVDTNAVDSANTVRSKNALVSVVAVQSADRQFLLDLVGGDNALAFQADNFDDRDRLATIIRETTLAICKN